MEIHNIGEVVYILHNNCIHSCLIVGIKVPYSNEAQSLHTKQLYNEKLVEYKLVTINEYMKDASIASIAQPDGFYHMYKLETKYGEHIRKHNEIFNTIEDAKNSITQIKNIVL